MSEYEECPNCGATDPRALLSIRDRSEPFGPVVGVKCRVCGEITRHD